MHLFPKIRVDTLRSGRIKGEHTCITPSLKSNHHKATSSFVRNVILYTVRKQLDISPGFIIKYIEGKYHISITYSKAWNARTKALMKIIGDWESSYETLPKYLDVVKASNLGTVTAHYYDHHSHSIVRFWRVFWAFGPSIAGFQYYRLLLSIDGTHLFWKNRCTLLIVTRVDADGGPYPLAFAVVEGETQAGWQWFISRIYDLISSVHQDRRITFLSDRHKGILNALDGWLSPYTHHYCLRHIRANCNKCSNCKQFDHNKARCHNQPVPSYSVTG